MQKKNSLPLSEADNFKAQGRFIKYVIVLLIHWADPLGWALLLIAALHFAGRV